MRLENVKIIPNVLKKNTSEMTQFLENCFTGEGKQSLEKCFTGEMNQYYAKLLENCLKWILNELSKSAGVTSMTKCYQINFVQKQIVKLS